VNTALEKIPGLVQSGSKTEEPKPGPVSVPSKESPIPTPSPQSHGSPIFTPLAPSEGSRSASGATTPQSRDPLEKPGAKVHILEITEATLLSE